ncbi:MAG: hypothetical protein KJN71_09395 [Acidimicrobiia bacterium]|nr:hypothetical protein [Acidimicrobiia bacterium]
MTTNYIEVDDIHCKCCAGRLVEVELDDSFVEEMIDAGLMAVAVYRFTSEGITALRRALDGGE